MTKKPDPTYGSSDAEHGSVHEPDGAEWPDAAAFEDAFVERNREELVRSLEQAQRDLAEGRGTPWDDAKARILDKLRASSAGE
jgi:hypothetical protein